MLQSRKLRILFVLICLSILLYTGLNTDRLRLTDNHRELQYKLVINEVMTDNKNSIRDEDGDFSDWIEIHNYGDTSINLEGFGLSNNPSLPYLWTFPDVVIEPQSFIIVWASEKDKKKIGSALHTSFKLKSKDNVLTLTSPSSGWKDVFSLEKTGYNISYGRIPDGGSELYGFDEGTPGRGNSSRAPLASASIKRLATPEFSHLGGFYNAAFLLSLSTRDEEVKIFYTMDGSVPTNKSTLYNEPIPIPANPAGATVIRARVYKPGYAKSEIISYSYFVDSSIFSSYNTPVVSIITDPENLFDYRKGIYIAGRVFDRWRLSNPYATVSQLSPANYNQRGKNWEREASVEFFEADGKAAFNQNIGIRTFGGYSRASSLKPLSLYARKSYDKKEYFPYDFFSYKDSDALYSRILLRTSGTDSKHSFFRDVLIQGLVQPPAMLDTQGAKPCVVYMNGEYYGIHNIRESLDDDYINRHYDIKEEDIVIIRNPTGTAGVLIEEGYTGDEMHYNKMVNFINSSDMRLDSSYSFIKTQMDIDNFIEYTILQIYCDNRDWPGNNVRIWRKRTQTYDPNSPYGHDGRWRWMVFDLDYGFGLYTGEKAARSNSLARATALDGPDWPNPPWSTLLLRTLLQNTDFSIKFINTFADRLNTSYSAESVLKRIQLMEQIYSPNAERHIAKWGLHSGNIEGWKNEVSAIKSFAAARPDYIRQYILEYFGLNSTASIVLAAESGGIVKLNSITIEGSDKPWEGVYFSDIPITLQAIPMPGYEFAGWSGLTASSSDTIAVKISQDSYLKATFRSTN